MIQKRVLKTLRITLQIILSSSLLMIVLFLIANRLSPLPDITIKPSTVVLDRNGEVLRHFSSDTGIFRHWVELDEVSETYLNALIAYEDRYYYSHVGINPLATLRALLQWIKRGKIISGSSTLTMQVARLIDPHERTITGKIKQMFRALQLEIKYSKAEILTFYLNLAPMGGNIEGVQTASWRYFSKKASELNDSESALLVAIPQRPSLYRPDLYPENASNARNKVLDRMVKNHLIDADEAHHIKANPIEYDPQPTQFHTPLLSEALHHRYPDQNRIETTIDRSLQLKIERFIKERANRWIPNISSAVLIVNNHTHEIVAYVGSVDMFDRERFGYVDMVMAERSPGSTLKPFAYGMALDYGIVHEASLLTDTHRNFDGYAPKNFDGDFRGAVTLAEALQFSLNVPVVQVFQHLTPHRFVKQLRDAQIRILIKDPNLSVVLGGVGISLYEQVRLFSSLATKGEVYPLIVTPHIESHLENYQRGDSQRREKEVMKEEGAKIESETEAIKPKPLLSEEASWLISHILSDIRPSAYRYQKRTIAWKTGTSYGYRDAWALGVSPDWTIGVWVGRPDGVPNVGTLANTIATPILFDLFNFLPKDETAFMRPYTVTDETICWPSGRHKPLVPSDQCEEEYPIHVLSGKIPPTLYDSPGEHSSEGWPAALKKAQSNLVNTRIETFADKSIIFKRERENVNGKIPLNASGIEPFRWYLNGVLLEDNQLDIDQLPLGKSRLSVSDRYDRSDSILIEAKPWD